MDDRVAARGTAEVSAPALRAGGAGAPPGTYAAVSSARPCLPAFLPRTAARESGHVSALLSLLNAKTGEVQRARPRCLLKGQSAVVEVTPARPLCLEEYSAYRALGRVALRDGGRTIAVGIVTALPLPGDAGK